MLNQLTDDGAVIGYRPNLEYNKDRNPQSELIKSDTEKSVSDEYSKELSSTLANFKDNLPSIALNDLQFAIDNMNSLINTLSNKFIDNNYEKYNNIKSLISAINNDNKKYIEDFVNYHKYNIKGSIVPELIKTIYYAKENLKQIENTLKNLYYGDKNITLEKATEKDKAKLSQLETYDRTNSSKVNYVSLSYDSQLNRSVSIHAFEMNNKAIDVSQIINNKEHSSSGNSSSSLLDKLYNETNELIDNREKAYQTQQNIEITDKALYNYYNKRQELLELYNIFDDNKDSIFIGNKVEQYQDLVENSLKNINKTFTGNQYYLEKIGNLEQEKYNLMNIYSNFYGNLIK